MSSTSPVAPARQGAPVESVASPSQPVPFSQVQAALNGIIGRWSARRGRPPHLEVHFGKLRWGSEEELLNSKAFGYPLVAPELRGNGRADETNLIRVLTGTHPDGMPRMPLGGPYATDQEIATIRNWINGLPPEKAAAMPDFDAARMASWLRPAVAAHAVLPPPASRRRA